MPELRHWQDKTNGYWFFQHPDPKEPAIGPYDTRREMLEDKAGIERTIKTKTWIQLMENDNAETTARTDETAGRPDAGWLFMV